MDYSKKWKNNPIYGNPHLWYLHKKSGNKIETGQKWQHY